MVGVIWDLDQTLIDSTISEGLRSKRNWPAVYKLIPQYKPYIGISESLAFLQANHIPYSIVTTSPRTYCERVIDHWKISCTHLVCYHDTPLKKPHPQPILKAVASIGSEPAHTLSLGDRDIDLQASRAAGVRTVACLWGSADPGSLLATTPDFQVKSANEIIPLFKKFFRLS